MSATRIICGLGNPGARYQDTRHNLGFWVVDLLRERAGARWRTPGESYRQCRTRSGTILVEPLTYMNLSGRALVRLADRLEFEPDNLLVVCDDAALPLGRLRLRARGSDGGHNGLVSVIEALGTRDFPRLRLGVGPAPQDRDLADFVLEAMEGDELEAAREMAARATDCAEVWAREGVDAAMSRFNTRGGQP